MAGLSNGVKETTMSWQDKGLIKRIKIIGASLLLIVSHDVSFTQQLPTADFLSTGINRHLLRTQGTKATPFEAEIAGELNAATGAAAGIKLSPAGEVAEHPILLIAGQRLLDIQIGNYKSEYERVRRITDIVFGNTISEEQKRRWRLLLLGTVAVESNFMDIYSQKTDHGSGPYQITGPTAYDTIHNYITFPRQDGKQGYHRDFKNLILLFEKATKGKIGWNKVQNLNTEQLRELCVTNKDFAALMATLIYMAKFQRSGMKALPADAEGLAVLWKVHYNSADGSGSKDGFVERFKLVHPPLSEALSLLYDTTKAEYLNRYSARSSGGRGWFDFIIQNGLDKDFSTRAAVLLRDEYGITPSNIRSKIIGKAEELKGFAGMWYVRLGEDKDIHMVITQTQDRIRTALVVCSDISKWAKADENPKAEIDILGDLNIVLAQLLPPFTKAAAKDTRSFPLTVPVMDILDRSQQKISHQA